MTTKTHSLSTGVSDEAVDRVLWDSPQPRDVPSPLPPAESPTEADRASVDWVFVAVWGAMLAVCIGFWSTLAWVVIKAL